ncbi:MAG: long-chain fatty acid--CoA ligase [Proteobacteria bacterium]|nr:long-chain fatty acid--CoA ligase [Pseudomonadota bacterium]
MPEREASLPGIGPWLSRRQQRTGPKEALVDGEVRLTYADLNSRVNRLARGLQLLGLRHGDRIAMLSYNRHQFVEVIFAAAKLGLILVPLNWRLSPDELAFIIGDAGAAGLIFDADLGNLARATLAKRPVEHVVSLAPETGAREYEALLAGAEDAEPTPDAGVGGDTPHILMYTAGTTGRPKGAVLPQATAFWNSVNLLIDLGFQADDRNLVVLPMFHIGGIGLFTLPMLHLGATVVIQRTFDAAETFRLIRDEKVTLFFGVPAVFQMLAGRPEFTAGGFDGVRLLMSGGAPLPISLVEAYDRAGWVLRQGFGMSEAAPSIATLEGDLYLTKAGSVGRICFHLEARVVDDQGRELPPGEAGELALLGPNLFSGYWNRPEATAESFRDGWFHTGDVARLDEDGCLYIVDRKKDMFISGGENVYPAEVEQAIHELAGVAEAAVIGLPDEKWGEVGLAVVVPEPGHGLAEAEIIDHLKGRLARFKVPKRVAFVPDLPRNAAGKVLKRELRREYS